MYFVYMIKNSACKLYIGITQNPDERVLSHNNRQGAKFTKYIPDFKIIFLEKHNSASQARQREIQLKKWRREKKEILVERYRRNLPTKI